MLSSTPSAPSIPVRPNRTSNAPTVLSHAPPIPSNTPPIPSNAPPIPSNAPPAPSSAPPIPSHAPPIPSPAPSVSSTAPSVPSKSNAIGGTDIETLRKSSNVILRSLGQNINSVEDLSIPGVSPGVEDLTGLHGRIRLQKHDQDKGPEATKWSRGNWMDSSRKTIQGYEYLCHIGEAKEWLESCLGEPVPDVTHLEQALRDGVILAKLTKVFAPHLVKKIFVSPKLQYRHTDNINYFFQFLDQVDMPDLFTFVLTDLYDKKNVPKVIYCLHALSYILYSKGMAPPMGDLVGKLEFSESEIDDAQKGLDKAGITLPNFSAVNSHFDPSGPASHFSSESSTISHSPSKYRSSTSLPTSNSVEDLRSELRDNLIRSSFRNQYQALVEFQARSRGHLTRKNISQLKAFDREKIKNIIALQSFCRGYCQRKLTDSLRIKLLLEEPSIMSLQRLARGYLIKKRLRDVQGILKSSEKSLIYLQSVSRAKSFREKLVADRKLLQAAEPGIIELQALCRARLFKNRHSNIQSDVSVTGSDMSTFQSICRGYLSRRRLNYTRIGLDLAEPRIIAFQAYIKAEIVRYHLSVLLDTLDDKCQNLSDFQALCRGHLNRSRIQQRSDYYNNNLSKVIKLQSLVRTWLQNNSYRSFIHEKSPSLPVVKKFIHLLEDNNLDFAEEIQIESSRKLLTDEMRNNESLEQYIDKLDVKIALLVKNKISLDEVLSHRNKGFEPASSDPVDDKTGISALDKSGRQRLDLYQGLFFILQTQPEYFAKLFQHFQEIGIPERETKLLEQLVLEMFGHLQKSREVFHFLRLISRSAEISVARSSSVEDMLAHSSLWQGLLLALNLCTNERSYLRSVVAPTIEAISKQHTMDLESNPLIIYRTLINQEELSTGHRSSRNPNIPVEEAINDEETRRVFICNLQDIRQYAASLFQSIEDSLMKVPYSIRYIVKTITDLFAEANPGISQDSLLSIAGTLYYHLFLHNALYLPEQFEILEESIGPLQRKNISEVSKVLSQIFYGRPFGADNVYLQPLNEFVVKTAERSRMVIGSLIQNLTPIEEHFEISVSDDLISNQRPVLFIKAQSVIHIHAIMFANSGILFDGTSRDSLSNVITKLGPAPRNVEEIFNNAHSSTEFKLKLNPSYSRLVERDPEVEALYLETKRCLLYIIKVQEAEDMMHLLVQPVSAEDEELFSQLKKKTAMAPDTYYNGDTSFDFSNLTYRELKMACLEKILELERRQRISRQDGYQDLLNALAVDIRTKNNRRSERKKELETVNKTLMHLKRKEQYLKTQLKSYNDYIEQAMATLQTKNAKRKPVVPFSKQYFHMRDLEKHDKMPKFGSYKYSAAKLFTKGVLAELDSGFGDRQYDKVNFVFSSDRIGTFTIEANYGSIPMPGALTEVTLDQLLSQQYDNQRHFELFDGRAKFNTNLFLHLVFKKFYNDA
ncbi:hypothetical protein CANCADRAFT_21430 [Tortispora caseinolytica NRRL Y-17796]|uniref:Ras-GAP domain-containing protein n=1 Tax=Tortispora caseinolytica NRRL Y-17796 TaxID=767744 RepID=A0A1E4TIY5_9ASCO|nr:hypothetical protein CANCADRAFT_21430 [Tortispora caseinolytica NRRL Y-17796]